jgi:AcrR family transcriptional regulator
MKNEVKKPQRNRSQKRAKRTRKRLKEAALGAFSEKSIDSVTVEEITDGRGNYGKS